MSQDTHSMVILVIEDDPGDFGLIKAYAHLAGLIPNVSTQSLLWAGSLSEGIRIANTTPPDVVLLDLSLPDSAGLETVQTLRAALFGIPIVVLTGHDDSRLAQEALEAGAQDYLVKGKFSHHELARTLRYALIREELDAQLRLFKVALNSVANAILITDAQERIQWVNPAFSTLTGYCLSEALGHRPGTLIGSGQQSREFYQQMWQTILSGQTWYGETINRRKDGTLYNEELSITPVMSNKGAIRYFVAMMQNITERKQTESYIRNLAFYDALTQLPNRRLLTERIQQAMYASERGGHYCALMFLDLDNFKPINDTYGHEVGDLLLIEAAQRLSACVRKMDTVARFGGDEFVVLLDQLANNKTEANQQALVIADKIRSTLATPYQLTGKQGQLIEHHSSASIGLALFSAQVNQEQLIKLADRAMYQAKAAGRNNIQLLE